MDRREAMNRMKSIRDSQLDAAAVAAAAKFTPMNYTGAKSKRRSSIVTYMSEQKRSLLGFEVLNRGTGRPANTAERIWEFTCASVNMVLQYYLLYRGGSIAFLKFLGIEVEDISDAHKMLIMMMFLENQVQATVRSWFVFQSSVFSGWFSSFMVFVAVRGVWYFVISVTAFTGNGMMPAWEIALWCIPMLFFQLFEAMGDYQLSQFVRKKQLGKTDKKVMREKLWSITRHPNMLGFIYWWPVFAFICTNNLASAAFYFALTHTWIFFQAIATNEGHMMRNYGLEYIKYQDEVPMLWPLLPTDYRKKIDW